MWDNIKALIARLFEKITNKTDAEEREHDADTAAFEDVAGINIIAMVAHKLATLTVSASDLQIVGDSDRAETINNTIKGMWDNAQEITARSFGTGGVALIPYVINNQIYTDIVPRNRFFITRSQGSDIIGATVIADVIRRGGAKYMRFTDYGLEDGNYIIRNRAVKDRNDCPLDILPEWQGIPEEIRIANCDRILLAYLRSPYNKGRTDNLYGVPISRGSEEIIKQIIDCLSQIKVEYAHKKVRIFADQTLFGVDDKLDASLYKTTLGGGAMDAKTMFEIFDPTIRDSAYYNRLEHLFGLLEKSIGTSRGILTDAETTDGTATAVRRASFDTYALISAMRRQWEKAGNDLVYAYNILCNAFQLCSSGDFSVKWSWSKEIIESPTEKWQQLRDGKTDGVVKAVELRRWLFPAETAEEAQAIVDEIAKNEPNLETLIGISNAE